MFWGGVLLDGSGFAREKRRGNQIRTAEFGTLPSARAEDFQASVLFIVSVLTFLGPRLPDCLARRWQERAFRAPIRSPLGRTKPGPTPVQARSATGLGAALEPARTGFAAALAWNEEALTSNCGSAYRLSLFHAHRFRFRKAGESLRKEGKG
jgi:hypothetical protein